MGKRGCGVVQLMGVLSLLSLLFMSKPFPAIADDDNEEEGKLKSYIVYVRNPEEDVVAEFKSLKHWHESLLNKPGRIVHSYEHVLNGFAARLTEEEAEEVRAKDSCVAVRPDKVYHLHTTHSPSFLGLQPGYGLWNGSNLGKGAVIGIVDSGINPDHPSFGDEGMPPPPSKWTGSCGFNHGRGCNNKVIGARNLLPGMKSSAPLDDDGHGCHTASTAAGNFVKNASILGIANGTAAGVAPGAHLAIYKVCSESGCAGTNILAAFDAAIADGVDVLSVSLGQGNDPFYEDAIAVGAFSAIRKGIFVSCSAGNDGPGNATVGNAAPWILTVGASTIDRSIRASVKLGNGENVDGESLPGPSSSPSELFPLVYSPELCSGRELDAAKVEGKVVLCDVDGNDLTSIVLIQEVLVALGAAGMILANDYLTGSTTLVQQYGLPATLLSYSAGLRIKAYINSTSYPNASIAFQGTVIGDPSAPKVISYSGRGPNSQSPEILKPDIIGPGLNILGAWPSSPYGDDTLQVPFDMMSGTSMSCPHLSGVAALIKASHPDWSTAAIKSAIMTTADTLNLQGSPILDQTDHPASVFAIGAGHVNPSKAVDPGLVYDIEPDDYLPYLCSVGYNEEQINLISLRTVRCSNESDIPEAQLNYPSFSFILRSQPREFNRTLTNVGETKSRYTINIAAPPGVDVIVKPNELRFTRKQPKYTYQVTFKKNSSSSTGGEEYAEGFLEWVSEKYSVRSPIIVKFE